MNRTFERIGIGIWALTVVALVVVFIVGPHGKTAGDIAIAGVAAGFVLGLAFVYKFKI